MEYLPSAAHKNVAVNGTTYILNSFRISYDNE